MLLVKLICFKIIFLVKLPLLEIIMNYKKDLLEAYLLRQIGDNHLVNEINQSQYVSRNMEIRLDKYVKDFIADNRKPRWIVIPGLRGVGKTTLIGQIYTKLYSQFVQHKKDSEQFNIIYISLDIINNFKANLSDVIEVYEQILGCELYKAKQPIFMFIDEVQTDRNWSQFLKTVYDRTPQLFMICTGSSATYLQMDANTAGRRACIERLYPLSFTEYQTIAHKLYPVKDLKNQIIQSLYYCQSAREVYQALQKLEPQFARSWSQYDENNIEPYVLSDIMPFALKYDNKFEFQKELLNTLEKIIVNDLMTDTRFNFRYESIINIKRLLLIIADNTETPSLATLSDALGVSRPLIASMLDALVKAELLIKIPAYGSSLYNIKAPARYQFMSSSSRSVLRSPVGKSATLASKQGDLLEDVATLHYYKEFVITSKGFLTYPYIKKHQPNCDFILQVNNHHQVALEFGWGVKNIDQVKQTMQNIRCDYGLVFSKTPLRLHEADNIVSIPLKYFFLI